MFFKQQVNNDSIERTIPAMTSQNNSKDDIPSIIAADLRIEGNLMCSGSVEVEGEIEGNVTCGNVTIRRTGAVKGDVTADVIQVDGEINGLVKGRNITLSETGRITGMIMYEALSVKDGAYIDGQCKSTDNHSGTVEAIEVRDSNSKEFLEKSSSDQKIAVEA